MKKLIALLTITVLLAAALVYFVAPKFQSPPPPAYALPVQQPPTVKLNADTIFNLVNAERVKAGLQPLVRDARLDATAQARADDMVARDYFSHYDPVTGESLVKIKPAVTDCVDASENISKIVGHADKNAGVVNGWMQSKPHHDAILDEQYDITGVAVNGNKVVQHFCNLK